jgi:guanylate kinase
VRQAGRICILDIDVQGVRKVKASSLRPRYLFVAPPSLEELERRLRGRGTETEEAVQVRLGNAAAELAYGTAPGNFDRVVVNNDLEACFAEVVAAFREWYPQLRAAE